MEAKIIYKNTTNVLTQLAVNPNGILAVQ
jgi:hypothetical protein